MTKTETEAQKHIQQLAGPDAVLIPKAHFAAIKARTTAIGDLLRKSGFCDHFKTSEEIFSGIGKFLTETQTIPHGFYVADNSWRNAFSNDEIYDAGILHSLSLFIAAKVTAENLSEATIFCKNSEGKYYVVLKYRDTLVQIERELEHYLYNRKPYPKNFEELIENSRVDLHSSKTCVRPPLIINTEK